METSGSQANKKIAAQFEKDKEFLLNNVDLIREPKLKKVSDLSRLHWYLHEKLRETGSGSTRWTDGRWRELTPLYGQAVAEAYRDGAIAYWRNYRPILRSEGAALNQTSAMVIFGLTGLSIEFQENSEAIEKLSVSEAELATRYAMDELNGFPSWFQALYLNHKSAVKNVLLGEIRWELSSASPTKDSNYVLSDVSWSGQWLWEDLAPELLSFIEAEEPKNENQLLQLLKVLQGSRIPDFELASLAESRVKSNASPFLPMWYATWIGVEPEKAISILEQHLDSIQIKEDRTQFAMRFVTALWSDRFSDTIGARTAFINPNHLLDLYFLMHKHIEVASDIDRSETGVHSPELRDKAQSARNRILETLIKLPGKDAFLALQKIAGANKHHRSYGYLEEQCKRKAEGDADIAPWSPNDFVEFSHRLDRAPSTHQELFEIALLRLLDLKDELENGDDSIAMVVKNIEQETVLRNYIGHELRQKAFGRYNIPQEEEMADAKKPDLRFHAAAIDAPVPCELKIADNWSGPSLFERLENQLAGDYLRDARSRRGIFALVYRGEKTGWELYGSSALVDFDQLVPALQNHWNSIASKYPNIDDITVIGIDLSKRNKSPL